MSFSIILAVAIGGAIGSMMRYGVNVFAGQILPQNFPWGTIIVNIAGSLAIGLIIELSALRWNLALPAQAFLITGILGGFTTFSAFSLDAILLLQRGQTVYAVTYASGSVGLSLLAAMAGIWMVRQWA